MKRFRLPPLLVLPDLLILILFLSLLILFPACKRKSSGGSSGAEAQSSPSPNPDAPHVTGFALYLDRNMNGLCDAGDTITVPFTEEMVVNLTSAKSFALAVNGDTLGGDDAYVEYGPASHEVTVVLGTDPSLKTRQCFDSQKIAFNSASGIDVNINMLKNALVSKATGFHAEPSTPIDVVAGFVDSGILLGSGMTSDVLVLDLDRDNDLDVIDANPTGPDRIWINDLASSGTFIDGGTLPSLTQTFSLAAGDVDLDGDTDLVAGTLAGLNELYLYDSALSMFIASGQYIGHGTAYCVVLSDVDANGSIDLVIGNYDAPNEVWLNNGQGQFTDSGQRLGNTSTTAMVMEDFNNDGLVDIFEGNMGQANRFWLNNRQQPGTFIDATSPAGSYNTIALAAVDLDGNGTTDLVEGTDNEADLLWLNSGDGTFTLSDQSLDSGRTVDILAADLDSDGDADLVVSDFNHHVRIWFNNGAGLFPAPGQSLPGANATRAALGDFDNDNDPDLVQGFSDSATRIWMNSLSGTWGNARYMDRNVRIGEYTTRSIETGDIDNDGDPDCVIGNYGLDTAPDPEPNFVWLYMDGHSHFVDSGQRLTPGWTQCMALGDLDLDGDPDLVEGTDSDNYIWMNAGGVFTLSETLSSGTKGKTLGLALLDIENDGDLDVVEGNYDNFNTIRFNDGNGRFDGPSAILGDSLFTCSLAFGDADNDGDLDGFIGKGEPATPHVRLWWNMGNATFEDSGITMGSASCHSIGLGDVDGDGDLDCVLGNRGPDLTAGAPNEVWLNNGSGGFSNSGQVLGLHVTQSVSLADVDHDNDLDLVEGIYPHFYPHIDSGENRIWFNDGMGQFHDSGQRLGMFCTHDVEVEDVDSDGDLDIITANIFTPNQVWLND